MRFLRLLGIGLLLLLLLPFLAVQFFGGSLAATVVRSLNNNLQGEITVEKYDVSWLRSFPSLSVDLERVKISGSDGSPLVRAGELGCELGFGALFGKIQVDGVVIRDGEITIMVDRDGNANYNLAGHTSVGDASDTGADAGATSFAIEEARLDNVLVTYRDAQLQTDAVILVKDATFSGDFGDERYVLETEGELEVRYLDQEGSRYAQNQPLSLVARTTVDNVAGSYTFSPLEITAGDLELAILGELTPTSEGLSTNLNVNSRSGSLEDILNLIPPIYAEGLGELETRGTLDLTANITGKWTNDNYPRIDGRMTFTDGRLGSPRLNVGAKNLDLIATFAYVDGLRGGVQTFSIDRFTGTFRGEPFDFKLRMEDLNDPTIDFSAEGSFPLETLPAFLGDGPVTEGDGFVRLEGLRVRGRYEDMIRPRRMGKVQARGTMRFDDGEITVNERELSFPAGTLELFDNEMQLTDFTFEAPGTELHFTGKATNLIPVLFADSLNTQDAKLVFEAELTGPELDIDELLALAGPTEEEIEAAAASGTTDSLQRKSIAARARVTDLLEGRFDANIPSWNWDKMEGADFRGQLTFSPKKLDVRGLTDAMDGQFRLEGQVYFQELQRYEARITAENVDARQFFYQSNEFDQDVLTSENLTGRMNGQLLITAYYDENGEFDYDRLWVRAGLAIDDGELNDFEMLESFAFALKAKDLDRVRFTRLENFFEIKEQTIYIPAMFIQSSAMNMTLSGSHTFEQYLEYYVKVNAGQVLKNKISRHDDQLEILPARRDGFFNLYYSIIGPLEDYKVESDKRRVKDAFSRSDYRRKRVEQELEAAFQTPIQLLERESETDDAVAGE